jgi:hypothetical protein
MLKIVTVVLKRDGSFHLASDSMPTSDAERWADEGYNVFRIVAVKDRWVMNHINSGKIVNCDSPSTDGPTVQADFPQLLNLLK